MSDDSAEGTTPLDDQWYWDRRNRKAYYPIEQGDTVRMVTVWHPDEVEGALDAGVLSPAEDVSVFEFLDSFRMPEDVADGPTGDDR